MSTTDIGRRAEQCVAECLKQDGYDIVSSNWRTRWCEIDIVAIKQNVVYFVEVKHRKSNVWGDGLAAITTKKTQQMSFAASLWVQQHKWDGDCQLLAASTYGEPPQIETIVEV